MTPITEYDTRWQQARQKRAQHAKQRRRQKAREHLQCEPARAQRHLHALEQALVDLGLPETVAVEVEWRLNALGTLVDNIFGRMCPTVCGCRTAYELTRVRGWDKHLPGRMLGGLPKRKWVRQLPHRGRDLLATLWHHVEDKSPATQSRWPWTWVADDSVFKQDGQPLGLVGTW